MPEPSASADSSLSAPLIPAPPAEAAVVAGEDDIRLQRGPRSYRVRGLKHNLSAETMKITLRASSGDHLHFDTLDLYQARARHAFTKGAALALGVTDEVIAGDLSALVLALEPLQEQAIRGALKPDDAEKADTLSKADEQAGLALLRDPGLVERIVADVEAIGVVGEGTNALVGYLAMVSRLLDKPLAILIQSTSAAGKSTLMDALLSLMPETQRVHYSAMTGQSLFYLDQGDLKHKILAIAEEEGVRQAAYALKLLQSQGELTIASTGKDPITGKLVTSEYRVEGPVMLCLTTTEIDIDEELLNRCLVLTINETQEQTAAIQQRQRTARTLAGLRKRVAGEQILAAHRAAQTLLRPLAVVNPFDQVLTFAHDRVRLRRDHQKYLALIDAIALLHQHQRKVGTLDVHGETIEYIEVKPQDVALANKLAHAVLGRSLDELPPQTRRVLTALDAWVSEQANTQGVQRETVRFTRRAVRGTLGLSDTQLRVHLERLVSMEYLRMHSGQNGSLYTYGLVFDGDAGSDATQLAGLTLTEPYKWTNNDQTLRGKSTTLRGQDPDLAGTLRPPCGHLAGTLRGGKIGLKPKRDAASSKSDRENAEKPRSRTPARRVNGHATETQP